MSIHSCISTTNACMRFTACVMSSSGRGLKAMWSWVSSAYRCMLMCNITKVSSSAVFSVFSMTLASQIVQRFLAQALLIRKRECTFMAALSFDFGISCSFGFSFCGSFFDSHTPCTAIVRHLLPVPLVDIGSVEVSLCAVHVV